MSNIVDASKPINFSLITFKKASKPFNGSIVINVSYASKPFMFKTCEMFSWGIQEDINHDTQQPNGKYGLQLQFDLANATPEQLTLFENLKQFEKEIIKFLMKETGKSEEVIREKLNPFIKYKKIKNSNEIDYTSDPTIKLKIRCNKKITGLFNVDIFGTNKQLLYGENNYSTHPKDIVPKYCKLKNIIKVGGIWESNKTYSVTFDAIQVAITFLSDSQIRGNLLLDYDDETKVNDDDDDEQSEYGHNPDDVKKNKMVDDDVKKNKMVDDDLKKIKIVDDEPIKVYEPEPEPQPKIINNDSDNDEEPEPVKKPAKKIVKTKK